MTDGLPFLPGNTYQNNTKTQFHRAQTLGYRNGYAMKKAPTYGIGGDPINYNQLSERELEELAAYNPVLTYGQVKAEAPPPFVPAYVSLDKKILKFKAVLKGTVHGPLSEDEPASLVDILYHLVDDTMLVVQKSDNNGSAQGKLLNRQRMPKNDVGDVYNWRDLNIGRHITLYGRVFYIYDCDAWTREWLESEGVIVNESITFNNQKQSNGSIISNTSLLPGGRAAAAAAESEMDKRRKFLELDRKVLRFYCVWDDRDEMFGDMRKFILHYYLVNDTVEVREIHTPNDGRDPFPVLISRQRVPKNRYDVEGTFPATVLELTDKEIKEYFSPKDFGIGRTVQIYNRRFFLYDCDEFTKSYYRKHFGINDFTPAAVDTRGVGINQTAVVDDAGDDLEGAGGEKTIHSCRTLLIKRPKTTDDDDVLLRYEAIYDSNKPQDAGRRFIISLSVSDNMISIYEPPVKNSGIIGGKFLERSRVAKPGSPAEKPEFYSASDFYVGAVIDVYRHRFIVTNADAFVLKYMEENSQLFTEDSVSKMRETIQGRPSSALKKSTAVSNPPIRDVAELEAVIEQVKSQLKRLDIVGHTRKDQVFLGVEMNRAGYISKENIRDMCLRQQLPADQYVVDGLAKKIGKNPDKITLEELRAFLEEP